VEPAPDSHVWALLKAASRRSGAEAPGRPTSAARFSLSRLTRPHHVSKPAVGRRTTPRRQSTQIEFQSLVGIFHPP
jgi:hypothetical protein